MSYFGATPVDVVAGGVRRRLVPRGAGSGPAAVLVPTPAGETGMEVPIWLFESAVALSSSSGALLDRYVHTPIGERVARRRRAVAVLEANARFDVTARGYRGVDPWSLPVSAHTLPRWRRAQDRWARVIG
jgi:hypothetical protein